MFFKYILIFIITTISLLAIDGTYINEKKTDTKLMTLTFDITKNCLLSHDVVYQKWNSFIVDEKAPVITNYNYEFGCDFIKYEYIKNETKAEVFTMNFAEKQGLFDKVIFSIDDEICEFKMIYHTQINNLKFDEHEQILSLNCEVLINDMKRLNKGTK